MPLGTWPPTLEDLKVDLDIEVSDTRKDAALTQALDAAVDWVQRVRPVFRYDPLDVDQIELPAPTRDHCLGTIRYAGRLHQRRRSPDGMISLGDTGAVGRVTSYDPDIDRLLRVGRFAPAVFA